jgi:hypothetical protein
VDPESAKFPVNFPVRNEMRPETSSPQTASTAISSICVLPPPSRIPKSCGFGGENQSRLLKGKAENLRLHTSERSRNRLETSAKSDLPDLLYQPHQRDDSRGADQLRVVQDFRSRACQ